MRRNAKPITIHMLPTTMYEIPRNGFLPPSHVVVDKIIRFVPPNTTTGYAVDITSAPMVIYFLISLVPLSASSR